MTTRDSVVIIGSEGDLGRQRLRPALRQLWAEGLLRCAAYLDISANRSCALRQDQGRSLEEYYFPIQNGCLLPLEELDRHGLIGPHVLIFVCPPTPYHVPYAMQFLGTGCVVAVEKPLTQNQVAARSLLPFSDSVFPVGHQLCKGDMLRFLTHCQEEQDWARQVSTISFDLWEMKGAGRRVIDDAVWDLGWHGFECILAPLRAAGYAVTMTVTRVRVATYAPRTGEPIPATFTAACIEGQVQIGNRAVPYRIRVGKGLAEERKQVVFRSDPDDGQHVVSLQESGWQAHYRVLRELLTEPRPDLKLSLADTVAVVQLCNQAGRLAVDDGAYPFGTTPSVFQEDQSWAASLHAAA